MKKNKLEAILYKLNELETMVKDSTLEVHYAVDGAGICSDCDNFYSCTHTYGEVIEEMKENLKAKIDYLEKWGDDN